MGDARRDANRARLTLEMRLVLHSTPDSVVRGDVSLMAISETLLAVAVSLFIALRWNDLHHVAVAVVLAPLLLMRTHHSTRLCWLTYGRLTGLWYHRCGMPRTRFGEFLETRLPRRLHLLYNVPIAAAVMLSPAPLALTARIIGCVGVVVMHPIASLSAVPGNWARVALGTDLFFPPEPLSESETMDHPGAPAFASPYARAVRGRPFQQD